MVIRQCCQTIIFLGLLSSVICFVELSCQNRLNYIEVKDTPSLEKCKHSQTQQSRNTSFICDTIESAFDLGVFNNTCLNVRNASAILNFDFILNNVQGFTLLGENNLVISCSASTFGIKVIDSTDIVFSSFTLRWCGTRHQTEAFDVNDKKPILSSGVYLSNIQNLLMQSVTVIHCHGYGIIMYNPRSKAAFVDVTVRYTIMANVGQYTFAGGMYIDFFNSDIKVVTVFINLSYFWSNKYVANNILDQDFTTAPFGSGGGVGIFLRSGTEHKVIKFIETILIDNEAKFGGGIYLGLEEKANYNDIVFDGVRFLSNNAEYSGGGLNVNNKGTRNTIQINKSHIKQNIAKYFGGGMAIQEYLNTRHETDTNVYVNETKFLVNRALLGSSIQMDKGVLAFHNTNISSSDVLLDTESGQGTVYATNSIFYFFGTCEFSFNNNTALLLDFSSAHVYGTLKFNDNIGSQGGALALYGKSIVNATKGSQLYFERNTATKNGGAVYVKFPGPALRPWVTTPYDIYKCFFQIDDDFQAKFVFSGNTAETNSGNDIFASTLQPCKRKESESLAHVILHWKNFTFEKNKNYSIVTNAVNATVYPDQWSVQPGRTVNATVTLMDERGQVVDEPITLLFRNGSNMFHFDEMKLSLKQSRTGVRVYGLQDTYVMAVVKSSSFVRPFVFKLIKCIIGYKFDSHSQSCICIKEQNIHCTKDNLYLPVNKWVYGDKMFNCPEGYCKNCSSNDLYIGGLCKFDPQKQCAEGRNQSSLLCSKCLPHYSVVFGSTTCKNCTATPSGWWKVTVVVCIIVIVLVVLLILLNTFSFTWYLIPTVYCYQVVDQVLPSSVDPFAAIFIEIFNAMGMDSSEDLLHICFFRGMDDLTKIALLYVIPLLWLIALYFVYKLYLCCCQRTSTAFQHSLVIISYMMYSNFAKVTFQVLQSVSIDNYAEVYIFASCHYATGIHLKLLVLAYFVLIFILIGFPFLLFCSAVYRIRHRDDNPLQPSIYDFKNEKVRAFYKGFEEGMWDGEYSGYVRINQQVENEDDKRYSSVFYFLARIIVFAMYYFAPAELHQTCVSIGCFITLVIFLLLRPYKSMPRMIFHTLQLATMLVISTLSDGLRWMYLNNEDKKRYETFLGCLVYFPLLMCLCLPMCSLFEFFKQRMRNRLVRCGFLGIAVTYPEIPPVVL